MTILPPLVGPSYDILVPTTDRDGIEIAGVHQVELLVPLGTWLESTRTGTLPR